ncbi:protein [Lentinula edodes]|uniref:Protein n=1 Tax=Lentinula edodes TaxID=5353 RepID=A0A1Q3EJN7_LENED|nr:protein [Lentinula edodes]
MKIFLGVIETDVLKKDVGLNRIDPRKLANGDWDEVVFVGEILCWIGRESGITNAHDDREEPAWRLTPSTAPDISDNSTSHRSTSSVPTADTSHSLHDLDHLRSFRSLSVPSSPRLSPLVLPRPIRPHCIHEVPSFYALDDVATTTSGSEPSSSSVRYTGHIQPVDEELELSYFENSRHSRTLGNPEDTGLDVSHQPQDLSAFADLLDPDPLAKTISLLQQRAFLLRIQYFLEHAICTIKQKEARKFYERACWLFGSRLNTLTLRHSFSILGGSWILSRQESGKLQGAFSSTKRPFFLAHMVKIRYILCNLGFEVEHPPQPDPIQNVAQ